MYKGYLGPDDDDILAAVKQVTGVYKYVHLNPFSLTDGLNSNHMIEVDHSLKVKVRRDALRNFKPLFII